MIKSHLIIELDTWVWIIGNFILQSSIKLKFKIHYICWIKNGIYKPDISVIRGRRLIKATF